MFKKTTVMGRLALGYGVFFVLLVVVAGLSWSRLSELDGMIDRIVAKDWIKAHLANEIGDRVSDNARAIFELFLAQDTAPILKRVEDNKQAISERLDALDKLIYLPKGKALLQEVRERRKTYVASFSKVADLLQAGNEAEARGVMMSETVKALNALLSKIDELIQFQASILTETGRASHETYAAARIALLLALAVAAAIGLASAISIIRSVTQPLGGEPEEATEVVRRIAAGDLGGEVKVRGGDQTSMIAAVSHMQAQLRGMIGQLHTNAASLSQAAEDLAASSAQVATGSQHQSESAAAMAATVEQMATSISHVAESASEADGVTRNSGELSNQGDNIIGETVAEMKLIATTVTHAAEVIGAMGDHSQRITGIVQVIREVADQTNLLALNAAIEAARAGEQGRGFAVVADEVRKLAERTAGATTEISNMIGSVQDSAQAAVGTMQQAVQQVERGVERAHQAQAAIREIATGAGRVVGVVGDISHALREQGAAGQTLAADVEQVAQMAEENSSAAQAAADTAITLKQLAGGTLHAVSVFRMA